MATALELANRALRVLGEPKITGFDDTGSKAALIVDLFFTTFRKHLSEDDWYWARERAELTEDEAITNLTELEYAYDLPSDLLIPRALFDEDDNLISYRIEGDHLFTDTPSTSSPKMLYTVDCLEGDGTDVLTLTTGYGDRIPDYWAESFAYTLAADLAFPITRDAELSQRIRSEGLFLANKRARELNAMSTPGYGEITEDWGGHVVAERRHPLREY